MAGGRFEINQLLLTDDTALMADSDTNLYRLVNECGRVCEAIQFRMNVCKSKVMRCSRHASVGRMHMRLNGKPLEEVDCSTYLKPRLIADG